jgi:lipopolysaccharide export system permease protein
VAYLVYWNLITAGQAWVARGAIPPALGLWWTHAAVLLLALAVIFAPQVGQRLRYRRAGQA